MSSEWDDHAEDWDSNPLVIEYAARAFRSLESEVSLQGLRVLDFGCGTGQLTERLSPRADEIVALDSSEKMIERLRAKAFPNVSSIAALLTRETVDETEPLRRKFDLVVASSVCGFLPDYEATASLLNFLLETNGVFVQWDWLVEAGQDGPGLSEDKVSRVLRRSGFREVTLSRPFEMEAEGGSMPVLMAIARKS